MKELLQPSLEVADALAKGRPIVALESSVWAQGLPYPANLETARLVDAAVRESGSVPAVTVLQAGRIRVGLTMAELEQLCQSKSEVVKVGCGDVPGALAANKWGATTVSASLLCAELLDIGVFATGGLGGVHRSWNQLPDISADLLQLTRTRCITVCSGVKSVLDVTATLEALEALAIPLLLYRTDHFPEFYTPGRPAPFGTRLDSPEELARAAKLCIGLLSRAPIVCQPCPSPLAYEDVERWLHQALRACEVHGKGVTPFLLGRLAEVSEGKTLEANRALLVENARLAGRLAVALAG